MDIEIEREREAEISLPHKIRGDEDATSVNVWIIFMSFRLLK